MPRRADGEPHGNRRPVPAGLAAALLNPELLPGAACAGAAPLWDEQLHGETGTARAERIASAIRVCHWCPARADCADLAGQLPTPQRHGIWAGVLIEPPTIKERR